MQSRRGPELCTVKEILHSPLSATCLSLRRFVNVTYGAVDTGTSTVRSWAALKRVALESRLTGRRSHLHGGESRNLCTVRCVIRNLTKSTGFAG